MMKKKPKWILLTAMILMLAGILAVCVLPKMIRDKDICEEADSQICEEKDADKEKEDIKEDVKDEENSSDAEDKKTEEITEPDEVPVSTPAPYTEYEASGENTSPAGGSTGESGIPGAEGGEGNGNDQPGGEAPKPEVCSHDWVAEYTDVWVEEKGHYEEGVIAEAYDEPVYAERCVCKVCGEAFLDSDEAAAHIITAHGNEGSWTVAEIIVSYIHHDAVFGDVFIVDEEAHWDKEIYRYRCSICGEIKYPE